MRAGVAALVIVASISIARAQPGMVAPQPVPSATKKVSIAMLLTLGTTAAGAGLLLAADSMACRDGCFAQQVVAGAGGLAMFVGPSLGHAYAGHTWNPGLGLRLAGIAVVALTWQDLVKCGQAGGADNPCPVGILGILGGVTAVAAGTFFEIATTPSAVTHYNNAHAWSSTLTLAPLRTRDGIAPGVAYAARF